MHKSILVVVSHPDDEVLGCGGTIAKHTEKGDIVNLVVMTDGVGSRFKTSNLTLKNRIKALKKSVLYTAIVGTLNKTNSSVIVPLHATAKSAFLSD